jgi:hypothetical protein
MSAPLLIDMYDPPAERARVLAVPVSDHRPAEGREFNNQPEQQFSVEWEVPEAS